jgi:hypothetical protein
MRRLAALLLFAAGQSLAQMDPGHAGAAARPALQAKERTLALDAIIAAIPKTYVFPEKAAAVVAALAQHRRAGRYDLADPQLLAERLTDDLRAASGDRHLYLQYDPAHYAAAATSAPGRPAGEEAAFLQRLATRDHHGLTRLERLPGNLRYLKVEAFEWVPDVTGTVYDEALRFLKDGDAIIIDLRGNTGGSHAAVRYLVSHFLDGDVLELTFQARGQPPVQSRTLEHLPAGRLKGLPLYVLIDGNVGSAAEAFAYDVEQFALGTLVGSTTAGAANNNDFTPIAPGFMFSIPFGRPEHAVSHTNWEAVGVHPTVEAPPSQALAVAQGLALARLEARPGLSAERRAEYDWVKVAVEAQLHPLRLAPEALQPFVGHYGPNEVALIEGALWLRRADRPARRLVPLTAAGLFAVEGNDALRVHLTGAALETFWQGDPVPRTFARSS